MMKVIPQKQIGASPNRLTKINDRKRPSADCPIHPMQEALGDAEFQVQIGIPPINLLAEHGWRFDTLGSVTAVTLRGHHFLGWPGLVDEFGIAQTPGYAQAKPGSPFLKIGIGELQRLDGKDYQFSRPYPVTRWGGQTVEQSRLKLAFRQNFSGHNGWAYDYHKSYQVEAGATRLHIDYALSNTGRHPLDTDQYNHNFFCFDGVEVSRSYRLQLGFPVVPAPCLWLRHGKNRLTDFHPVAAGSYFASTQAAPADQNHFRVTHQKTGQSVLVHGDYPVSRFALWANQFFLSPEVFVAVRLMPGQSLRWRRSYEFHLNADPRSSNSSAAGPQPVR